MKKVIGWLVGLIIVVAVVIGGTVWWAIASSHRVNLSQLKVEKLTSASFTAKHEVKNLAVTVRTAVVTVKSGSQFKVQATNVTSNDYQVKQIGDTVTVKQSQAGNHQLELGKSARIVVTVPSQLTTLSVAQLNGTLKMAAVQVGHLTVTHDNGTTLMNGVTVLKDGTLTKKNGATTLTRMHVPGVKIGVKNGQAQLNGKKVAKQGQTYNDNQAAQLVIMSGNGQVNITTD